MRASLLFPLFLCIVLLAPPFGLAEEAPPAEADAKAFTPPPGWRPKQRGKFTVYCRKQVPMGSRIPTEVCHDETGIRAMLASLAEEREKLDQIRRVCSSQAACGSN